MKSSSWTQRLEIMEHIIMSRMLCCQCTFSVVNIFAFPCYILNQIEDGFLMFSKKMLHFGGLLKKKKKKKLLNMHCALASTNRTWTTNILQQPFHNRVLHWFKEMHNTSLLRTKYELLFCMPRGKDNYLKKLNC